MPLVSLLDGVTRIDATDPDESLWHAVWRARPPRDLSCRECGTGLTAVDRRGTRFFRHHRRVDCTSVNESPEHLRLKTLLAAAVRAAGWTALVEEPVPPRKADVLAVAPDGRKVAVEVQLSPQLATDTAARTADYAAAGVATLWVVHDPARLGHDHDHVPRLVLSEHDRVTAPLLRLRTVRDSVWDGQASRRLDVARWQQVSRTVQLDAMLTALGDGRVVWSRRAGGWVPAREVAAFETAAAQEASARAAAAGARQELAESEDREKQRRLAEAAEQDPTGHATAVRVAEGLTAAGHSTPRILKGANAVAYAWVVRSGDVTVNIDPDPAHLDRWLRWNTGRRRRFWVRAEINQNLTVASASRHAGLEDEVIRLCHVDEWQAEPALLPSPDGSEVAAAHLDAARRVVAQIVASFGQSPRQACWNDDHNAWVWTLPDGATVALAARTGPEDPITPPGSHRAVVYLNRRALAQDTDRCVVWRNLAPHHVTGDAEP